MFEMFPILHARPIALHTAFQQNITFQHQHYSSIKHCFSIKQMWNVWNVPSIALHTALHLYFNWSDIGEALLCTVNCILYILVYLCSSSLCILFSKSKQLQNIAGVNGRVEASLSSAKYE